MVKRRNLRPDPRRAMADLLAKQAAQTKALGTVPTGVKDLGETGDEVWTDPDSGEESSVRELPALIDETAVAIEAAKEELEETRGDLEGAKADLEAERAAREQALAAAAAALAELDEKLEAGPSTADLDAIRTDLAAAAEVAASATTAATEANTAALAASQAALEAAGIAASKGRVIVSETEPTGADRTPSNIWIQPVPDDPDTEVQESAVTYVYLEASDEWQATTSSELAQAAQNALDAREAAQQAQQRADTAVSNAATAQAAAEAAQRTANQATLDAAGAHNAAVAAQDSVNAAIARGDNLILNGGFEQGDIGWPTGGSHGGRSAIIEDAGARTGTHVLQLTPTTANAYPESDFLAIEPGRTLRVRGWVKHLGGNGTALRLLLRQHDVAKTSKLISYPAIINPQTMAVGEWTLLEGDVQLREDTRYLRFAFHGTGPTTSVYHCDDLQILDITEAALAAKAAAAAQAEAASKATPAQVTAAANAAESAAKTAAAADAKAKADQAKADALAGAATDAKSKADAAQAAAVAAASADAKTKADKALSDALAALAKARGEISAEITTSANGKNAITVSSAAASASKPGVVAGDTWWRVDSAGTIFGQWTWTGTAWVPATIRSEVIANLDVSKLVVTGDARFTEAVVERLFADVFAAHKITANELSIGAVGADGELVADSVRGVHIGDGQVSANKLLIVGDPDDPDEVGLVARIAAIMHLAVEHLVVTDGATIDAAVILKLASEMVTAGVIRTAETGQRVVIDQGGVVLIGLDADGFEYELVRLGPSGENLLTIGKTTVAPDGIATPSLEAGEVAVNGRTVADMISDAAQGTVAWAYATNSTAWDGSATELRRMQVSATLLTNRRYSIVMDHRWARVRGTGTVRLVERLRYSTVGDSQATTSWGQLAVMGTILANTSQSQTVPQLVGILDTADLGITQATTVWFRWTTQGPGSRDYRIEGASGETIRLTLRDEGPSVSSSGMSWFSTGSAVEGATEAPPEVVEKVTRTEKFAATRAESWNRGASSFLSGKSGTVYQGKYPSVSAREGAWWFPALTGNLSGAKIKRVQLRFYIDHTYWGAGGTADIRLHGKTGFTTGGLDTSIRTLKVKREAQYSIDVPASYLDGFRTGTWRGFGLSTSSTNLEYYVQATLANAEIWITYEK